MVAYKNVYSVPPASSLSLQFGTLCPFPLIPSKNLLHGRFDLPRNVASLLVHNLLAVKL